MKEANWNDCLGNNLARKITPDNNRAKSLSETAHERIAVIKEVSSKNCNFVFEDYYTSVLELLQAHAFRNGFLVLNHLCIGFYIRDNLQQEDIFHLFNDVRYKRNSLTYYGTRMDYAVAKEAIEQCKRIMKTLSEETKK